ncbi:hypothetical protein GobsT_30980 [Gemmata obscuriglobus]|uniref:Uncharacterized protein n=1 Tax=Gemmata obscuriglobus TaxID=114 RepID=A0A2Z3H1I7_9BACT|nr:hypothetical protein [Gemmata obscuriglobus]AWM38711.1 hypothetical protein C1280_18090 [Gemmata obscuriglobus]QEG28321.1 hypothetical protein GobsT_30980 [Gemmata obscuriglobus]VTS06179.1 unnamed protein product [Gemmata obscuriglobus UQM 2246]
MNGFGGNGTGNLTQSAGTRIRYLIQPNRNGRARVTKCVYTAGATAHPLTFARPLGRTTASAAAAAGQAVINLTSDPGPSGNGIAANDLLAIRETDGVTRLYTVQSVSALAITLTSNLVAGAAAGAKVWNFGLVTDVNPADGVAHPSISGIAGQTTTYEDREGGLFATFVTDDPILFDSGNATNAGTLQQLNWSFTVD